MKYQKNHYSAFVLFLAALFFGSWSNKDATEHSPSPSSSVVACQTVDSLALIEIHRSTNGPFWTRQWDLRTPVCDWYGINLNADGYVVEMHLNSNGLVGTLPPEIGNFSQLEYLQIDNNSLSGNLPEEIGNLTTLTILFLDDNNFTGTIPDSYSNLTRLQTVYLDNNQLSGPIPPGFASLNNLFGIDFFNNGIDSLPDLSALNLQRNRFNIYNNKLTFDDIIPNLGFALGNNYTPQDSVFIESVETVATGTYYEIDLGIDAGISDNEYQWYKDGLPFGPPSNSNTLVFPAIDWSDAGRYTCIITNPRASALTLYSRGRTLQIVCGTSVNQVVETLCDGDERIINGITYNATNPSGTQTLSGQDRYGCDSVIQVALQFAPNADSSLNLTLCEGQSLSVGGSVFNESRPSGTVVLSNQAASGCDSTVEVNLLFQAAIRGNLSLTLCPGQDIDVQGQIFDEGRPNGEVLISNGAVSGCDSIVEVNLGFYPAANGQFTGTFCEGSSFVINGTTYDQSNPNGTETLTGASQFGCDSLVSINLLFESAVTSLLEQQLCSGDFLLVNGQRYDESQPTGTERIANGATNGCDSIVQVQLSFATTVSSNVQQTLCPGESIQVNGTTYDEARSSGTEVFPAATKSGCDSTVFIDLSFHPAANGTFTSTLCEGASIQLGGVVFDQSNPSGTIVLPNASVNGCDSSVQIQLSFDALVTNVLQATLCQDEQLIVNGRTYNQSNPTGNELFKAATANGCDSLVQINLSFYPAAAGILQQTLCEGEFVLVNGQRYDESQPNGQEVLDNASVNGCDSTVQIQLDFNRAVNFRLEETLCPGEVRVLNGTTYDENNFSGTEIINGGAQNGCDSIVDIILHYPQMVAGNLSTTLCEGSRLEINGTTYDEDNPSGVEVISNGSILGCDSTVIINLSFRQSVVEQLERDLCKGSSLLVGGTLFDESNPNGQVLLTGGAQSGCDSIVEVQLRFREEAEGTLQQFICPGETIQVNGQTYDENRLKGFETLTNASIYGCDSFVVVDLELLEPATFLLTETLCASESREVNGNLYNIARPTGTERLVNAGSNGCDSIVQIQLDFLPNAAADYSPVLCRGESLLLNGSLYDENRPFGREILRGQAANGCDSVINISLEFREATEGNFARTLCDGESIELFGETFNAQREQGVVILDNANQWGCDSIVQVSIDFYAPATASLEQTICEGAQWSLNGEVFDRSRPSGRVVLPLASVFGCDSTVAVQLDFFPEASSELSQSICQGESFDFQGESYTQGGTYRLVLSAASMNGCDSSVYLNLEVEDPFLLGFADAGFEQEACESEALLEANLPQGTRGKWRFAPNQDYQLSQDDVPEAVVSGLAYGSNLLYWTLSTDICPNYDTDTLEIVRLEAPQAEDDRFSYDQEIHGQVFQFDVLQNDLLPSSNHQIQIVQQPDTGLVRTNGPDRLLYVPPAQFNGLVSFQYEVCLSECQELCDTATVQLNVRIPEGPVDPLADIPNGITPNQDGVNDAFVIPYLLDHPDSFPDRELVVFNRWGDIIYRAKPYQNDWEGTDGSGKQLVEGTYYFILRLDVADGLNYKGDITIIR
ncbi:MAG: gliding motility-associated C-terminal domain-containing protein [Bacteroidota bacterium]